MLALSMGGHSAGKTLASGDEARKREELRISERGTLQVRERGLRMRRKRRRL